MRVMFAQTSYFPFHSCCHYMSPSLLHTLLYLWHSFFSFPGEHPFARAAVMHFTGVSFSECLLAARRYMGVMLGREQHKSLISAWLQICWETLTNWAASQCLMFQTHLCSFAAACAVTWACPGVVLGFSLLSLQKNGMCLIADLLPRNCVLLLHLPIVTGGRLCFQ